MQILKLLLLLFLLNPILLSHATVFYSKNEAMALAFGEGTPVESLALFPDENEAAKIQELAKTPLESGLFTFYVGKQQQKILGFAAIETTTVRTKPETLMIVLTPEGELKNVYALAFHEPPEYQPSQQWYDSLAKRPLAELNLGRGVDGISGATLSTRATLASVRKVMAVYEIMIRNKGSR